MVDLVCLTIINKPFHVIASRLGLEKHAKVQLYKIAIATSSNQRLASGVCSSQFCVREGEMVVVLTLTGGFF